MSSLGTSLIYFRRLADHLVWADALVIDGLRNDPGSDPATLEYLAHILGTEHVWLSRMQQREVELAVWPKLSLDECQALAGRNARELTTLLEGMAEEDLAREVAYRNTKGVPFTSRMDDMLLHVMLHGAYHRGQVALMRPRGGGSP